MKRVLYVAALFILISCLALTRSFAQDTIPAPPDTVKVGIYVTSIHDIDFKQKEFTAIFWLWLRYKNKAFNFDQYLEIPRAKTVVKSFSTTDSSNGTVYMLMKMQCVMKDSWKIGNFPFDKQKLRLSVENSQFDSRSLVFVADTVGQHYDPRFTLNGWNIDSFITSVARQPYETNFGDNTIPKPHMEYSAFKVRISINRDAGGLFWKMFLGMYVSFLIAFICFFIHSDGMDSRFGLSVGSLFAVIGNKYIIDSSLPESSSFTLVDTLHGMTLFFILATITCTAISLKLVKQDKLQRAKRFDHITAFVLLSVYTVLNIYFIVKAQSA
jgi:hypothetical protein